MALNETVSVWILTEPKPIKISCTSNPFTAEDLCKLLCQKCNISPLTRTLFALRIKDTDHFLKDNSNVLSSSREYELRIRVKVPRLETLMSLDENTYNYYYLQAKRDVNNEKVPEIKYPVHKEKLLGLGITDMARAVSEENMTLGDIEKNTKIFIPKVLLRKHWHFAKKHARMTLPLLCKQGYVVSHLKNSYLKELYTLAPNYLSEEFDNVIWQNGTDITPIRVVVAAFDPKQPGITFLEKTTNKEFHACTIEELIYLTRNGDRSLEISRRGTPLFLKFKSEEQLSSFISLCDLYYRLMVKWTFNLSKDDETPSLKELHRTKCHGPVGGAFSYRKLEEKRGKKHGCYILRECQDDYNVYYLDVCTKSSTTETYKIEFKGDRYIFNGEEYYSLERLVKCHENPDGRIYLNECIPPSEYDKSQLLLCGEQVRKGVRIDQAELQELLKDNKSPRCLPNKDIMLYQGSEKFGSEGLTATYKALWKLNETKKLLVAFKRLHGDRGNDYLKDFIDLASKWACIQSSSIVRLYGVTLGSPTAMVLEYLPLGAFSEYLRAHGASVRPLQLLKASASVARALWDLSEAGVVHGNIRAHRLLLAAIDTPADRIVVKLAGPSLHRYTKHDVHWIPVQFYDVMDMSRRSVAGDIWAFATTLWEIFSYGQSPTETNPVLTAKSYEGGERLHRPKACPSEVYALMRQCWQPDPLRPQEIMRDINHMLYREYIPTNDYEVINLDPDNGDTVSSDRFIPSEISDAGSNKSLISMNSSFPSMNGTMSDHYDNNFADNRSSGSLENAAANGYGASLRSFGSSSAANDDLDASAPRLMESVVSQGMPYLVTLTKKIGSGTYGHVYRGWMEKDNQESQRKEVAVKKLTRHASERNGTLLEDFKNELEIMKSLQHVNIVEILGYSWDGSSDVLIVMEYLEEGSLNYFLKFRGDKLRPNHLLQYAKDIATGMDHMSAKNIVHRDLATRNILVVNRHHVKISDFGLARIIPKEESSYRLKTSRLLPFNWYAPESAVEPFHFSTKSDVWSYGVTVWEIFTRARVDVPRFDLERPQHRAECFEMPNDCPPEVYRYLMKDCWELDPSRRPRFIDLILKCKMLMEKT